MSGPPIRDGAVLVADDGRISSVGADHSVPAPPEVPSQSFPDSILIPGLINAHSHLELTGLDGRLTDPDFPTWIRGVRALKASLPPEWFCQAARQGVRDAFAAGITTVLDTGDSGAVLPALAELGGSGIAYQEVFGPDPNQLVESLAELESRVGALRRFETDRVRLGVSPHAPYTVSGPLYRAVAELAARERLPVAVHLAESSAEHAFVSRGVGPFADAWLARGIPPLERHGVPEALARRSPVAWLAANGVLGRDTLCIHTVQVDAQDIALLAERGVAIAHCPRSNSTHRHGEAPLGPLRAAGIRIGVGTDSVLSGRLDLFAELRAARALGRLTAADALALATTGGAQLLGQEGEVGALVPGAYGDCVMLAARVAADGSAEEAVLAASPDHVRATYVAGRQVFCRPPSSEYQVSGIGYQ